MGNQEWNNLAFLFAWGADGNLLNSNFPIQFSSADFNSVISGNQEILVGDINGNGNQETDCSRITNDFNVYSCGVQKRWNYTERLAGANVSGHGRTR